MMMMMMMIIIIIIIKHEIQETAVLDTAHLVRKVPVGQSLFILEVSRSHTTTHHSR